MSKEVKNQTKNENFSNQSQKPGSSKQHHSNIEDEVFQKAKEPWELAIEKMSVQMEMLMRWQNLQMNNQEKANFDRNNYNPAAQPNLRPQTNWPTQSQSQIQNLSQPTYSQM